MMLVSSSQLYLQLLISNRAQNNCSCHNRTSQRLPQAALVIVFLYIYPVGLQKLDWGKQSWDQPIHNTLERASTVTPVAGSTGHPHTLTGHMPTNIPGERTSEGHRRDPFGTIGSTHGPNRTACAHRAGWSTTRHLAIMVLLITGYQ